MGGMGGTAPAAAAGGAASAAEPTKLACMYASVGMAHWGYWWPPREAEAYRGVPRCIPDGAPVEGGGMEGTPTAAADVGGMGRPAAAAPSAGERSAPPPG